MAGPVEMHPFPRHRHGVPLRLVQQVRPHLPIPIPIPLLTSAPFQPLRPPLLALAFNERQEQRLADN